MKRMTIILAGLVLAACGQGVEPETVETEPPMVDDAGPVDHEPVPEIGSAYSMLSGCEEVSASERRCEGQAGYTLRLDEEAPATLVLVGPEGEEQAIDFTAHVSREHEAEWGRTVEWRGATAEEPRVLLVRMRVAEAEDPMAAETSYLAVVRLQAPACIIARVPPGPGQMVAARRFADRETLPDCLVSEAETVRAPS